MVAQGEDELICDFAEFYHIYDYRALPISYAAVLAVGLGENSRIKRHLNGMTVPLETLLLAAIADRLAMLCWLNSDDGAKGKNHPQSIAAHLTGSVQNRQGSEFAMFENADSFEAARQRIIREKW